MPLSTSTPHTLLPLLLDSLQDHALFMMDASGRIISWSPGVLRILGYDEPEFIGQSTEIVFTSAERQSGAPHQELASAARHGRAVAARWHVRRDGTLFWGLGHLMALIDEGGVLRGYARLLRDDTRQKMIDDELMATRERLQTALDVGRIGIWNWDIRTDRVSGDTTLSRYFGVSPDELGNCRLERFTRNIHPEDQEKVAAEIGQSLQQRAHFSADYRILQQDGTPLWVEARGKIESDETGEPRMLSGVILDISLRKRAEEALRRSEVRYRTLFEALDNGFCVIQMMFDEADNPVDYRFLEINPAFEGQTGLHNALGKTMRELVPNHDEHWFQIYGQVAITGNAVHFENSAEALGRWFDVHAFRVGEPAERRVAVMFTDISARKRGEAALRQAHAHAEETNRMKDEFLATLSHEMRTPLNAILGWASLLRTESLTPEQQHSAMETIERNARAQAQLINELLDVSRVLSGKLQLDLKPVDLTGVLEHALNTVKPAAVAKGVVLEDLDLPACADAGCIVAGDFDRLGQVFWNLLTNAIKFTPGGGSVRVHLEKSDSAIKVRVSDTGKGIDAEFLPFMFERFRQADSSSTRAHGGLGIGLALVRHLTEAHGGTVAAESPGAGKGATLTVTLPTAPGGSHGPIDSSAASVDLSAAATRLPARSLLSGVRVLVVDDEPDAGRIVQTALEGRAATAEVAQSAAEAWELLEACETRGESFDVLISDIGMPHEDGYALLRRVRAWEATTGKFHPAIALTASADHETRMSTLRAGFQMHLVKPVDLSDLLTAVADLTGRHGPTR